jgi:hypothetical protein
VCRRFDSGLGTCTFLRHVRVPFTYEYYISRTDLRKHSRTREHNRFKNLFSSVRSLSLFYGPLLSMLIARYICRSIDTMTAYKAVFLSCVSLVVFIQMFFDSTMFFVGAPIRSSDQLSFDRDPIRSKMVSRVGGRRRRYISLHNHLNCVVSRAPSFPFAAVSGK